MYTGLLSIQQLNLNNKIKVFALSADHIQWTCVVREAPLDEDEEYFPIRATGEFKTLRRGPSAETEMKFQNLDHDFTFRDSYFGKEGTVFIVILPEDFIPDVISFNDEPNLPVNVQDNIFTQSPGSLKIAYNKSIKRSCVIIQLYQTVGFEMFLRGKRVKPAHFPASQSLHQPNRLFDVTLSRKFLGVDHITNDDLKIINETVAHINIDALRDALEELLASAKDRNDQNAKTALRKIKGLLTNVLSNASSLTTLIDSYNNHAGAVHLFIAQALKLYQGLAQQ